MANNILMIFSQCFGGNWLENFNATTGEKPPIGTLHPRAKPANYDYDPKFDTCSFTNTTVMSAQDGLRRANYDGYHDDAAEALEPGAKADDIHEAGKKGRLKLEPGDRAQENPKIEGDKEKTVGGENSTHVLVWVTDPNFFGGADSTDITNIVNNFANADSGMFPNVEVTVLAGCYGSKGTSVPGASLVGDATVENLEAEIARIGPLMTEGEQFVFFVGDHGEQQTADVEPKTLPAKTTPPPQESDSSVDVEIAIMDAAGFMIDDLTNIPNLEIVTNDFIAQPELISVEFNGAPAGTLDDAVFSQRDYPGMGLRNVYTLELDESFLFVEDPLLTNSALLIAAATDVSNAQVFRLINNDTTSAYTFDIVALGTGAIARTVPEPGSLAMLAAMLLWGCRRDRSRYATMQ